MRSGHLWGLLVLVTLGCGGGRADAPAAATAPARSGDAAGETTQAAAVSFAWPVASVVAVRERVQKKDIDITLEYDLHICPDDRGLRVRHRDVVVVAMGERDLESPETKQALAELQPLLEMIPDMIVSDTGEFLAIDGLDAMVDALAGKFPHMKASLTKLKSDPAARAQLEQLAGDIWRGWVSHWLRFDGTGPDRQTIANVVFERLASGDGRLELRATRNWDPEVLRAAVMKALGERDPKAFAGARIERTDVFEVTTDPSSLRPSRARRSQQRLVELPSKPSLSHREVNDYAFDWEKKAATAAACP